LWRDPAVAGLRRRERRLGLPYPAERFGKRDDWEIRSE
jgi:hypothetical protein